jgi:arylsulfatase A-like enzyme
MISLLLWVTLVGCGDSVPTVATPTTSSPELGADIVVTLVTGVRSEPTGNTDELFLDATGLTGTRFVNAYAQSPAGFASLGSLLTGRYVGSIPMCGLLLEGDRVHTDDQQAWCAQIPEQQNTLAEVLGLYGYRTAFFTGDLASAKRLAHGFGTAEHYGKWSDAVDAAKSWWGADSTKPRLLVLVLSDDEGDILQSPALPRFPERKYQWLEPLDPRVGKVSLDADSVAAAYTAAAVRAGTSIASLLKSLDGTRPRWTVAGSTNGMSLTERGGFYASAVPLLTNNLLVDRAVRVPLLLSGPGQKEGNDGSIVELVDIFPTLTGIANAVPPAGQPGSDLRTPMSGTAYAEFGDMLSVRHEADFLVFRCTQHNATSIDPGLTRVLQDPNSARPPEFYSLYNVVEDPMQEHNLRQSDETTFVAMRKRMIALRTGAAAVPDDAITPERLWALRMAPSDGYW